jgi:hypothetical protein
MARGREGADIPDSQRIADGCGHCHQPGISGRDTQAVVYDAAERGGWDVTADGKRFLATVPPPSQQSAPTPITVVLNWEAGLKK